ncbi:MAG: TolC family protein [Planctomycetota bacterium]
MSRRGFGLAMLTVALCWAGCARDPQTVRREHAARFGRSMADATTALLTARAPLDLDDCIEIALERSLEIRTADLRRRLAAIDRQSAFGSFLPKIELEFARSEFRYTPTAVVGSGVHQPTTDRATTTARISVQQPLFVPQAYFLYLMHRSGEDMAGLLAERTRQQIALHVAARYYRCLADAELIARHERTLERTRTLRWEIGAFVREGLGTSAEGAQADALFAAARLALADARRSHRLHQSELLEAMGLHPLAELTLCDQEPRAVTIPALATAVERALLQRLELSLADRELAQRRHEVRAALVAWLPKILGFGALTLTSDSHQYHDDNVQAGISGVLTVLDGFRNVNAYRAARSRVRGAMIRREQRTLAIMREVLAARQAALQSEESLAVARQALDAARQRDAEMAARWREGLERASDRLAAAADLAEARTQAVMADYARRLALATLEDVQGRSWYQPPVAQPEETDG